LAKFAGVGRAGEHTFARAAELSEAGLTPPVLGYRHGFLVERWLEDAEPLDRTRIDREVLIRQIARYLAFRARRLPAAKGRGASLVELAAMARTNSTEALGVEAGEYFDGWARWVGDLARNLRPIEVDGRLHEWEWLRRGNGELLKSDALDHCAGHDLVGCQDVAWDIVGAAAEFELSSAETEDLACRVGVESGFKVDPVMLAFFLPCYLAFQLGYWTMAALALDSSGEADRLQGRARFYQTALRRCLSS
jgi:hypothetical protein